MSTETEDDTPRRVLRLAICVGLGLTLTTIAGIAIPGLAPVLALQMLLAPALPGFRQGVFLAVMVAVVTAAIHGLALSLGDRPELLVLLLTLLYSVGFMFQPRAPVPSLLFLITLALVPVWMAQTGPGGSLYQTVAIAVPIALIFAWLIDILLPAWRAAASTAAASARPVPDLSPATAVIKGIIVLPVQLFYIQSPSAFSMAGLVTLIIILTLPTRDVTLRVLVSRVVGNIVGGVAAWVAFILVFIQWSPVMLLLVALLGALLIGRRLVRGGNEAAVMSLALVNFTLLLGIAVSQQIGGEPVDLFQRIRDIAIIATYGVGASSLLRTGYYRPA